VTPRNNFKTQIVNLLLCENNQTTGKGPLSKHDNTVAPLASKTVNIAKLKDFVVRNFPPRSPLQVIFVDEDNELSPTLGKIINCKAIFRKITHVII